ncbi:MAG: type VI secretion system ATPase TssH [Chitinispirillaceae bacterium]
MIVSDIRTLLEKLNPYCQKKIQSAVGACVNNGNYELTWEHLLASFLEDPDNDVALILRNSSVNADRLRKTITLELESLPKGNSSKPAFSPSLLDLIEKSWSFATLRYNCESVRSGILFAASLESVKRSISDYAAQLRHLDEDSLRNDLMTIVAKSSESGTDVSGPGGEPAEGELEKYCKNLTAEAKEGKTDPILGRDSEIFQVIDILSRRKKNNPILVGEAGVGKTAVIEGLAQQIAAGDVPDSLKGVEVWELDMGLLQAGASVKGEFEKRLKSIIDTAKKSAGRIILFIDEAHTLIGAGGAAGMADAANLLKPALARGELRTCAATTWLEYRKYFEKDPALTRRFQPVKVDEPDEEKCFAMIRGIAESYEAHHGVHITEEGIRAAVSLSKRFISGRQLPDKAVDVLDTASTRVKMSRTTTPPAIEHLKKTLADADRALKTLNKDKAAGIPVEHKEIQRYEEIKSESQASVEELTGKWEKQKRLVDSILSVQKEISDLRESEQHTALCEARVRLDELNKELSQTAGEAPMVHPHVSGEICARVIADWTGIPVGSMVKDEAKTLLELEKRLSQRVKGQDAAVSQIASTIRSAKTGMTNPDAPLGVFLCTGPSGVGKTECALALADLLFGGEKFSTVINMSEYQEKHTVSQLKGSPPGYVGYGEGGVLTEAVRQKPYSIVILDEVEKAHRDVLNMFYQVFDKGSMRDGEGRDINFRNTVIMMTSNLGSETIIQASEQGIGDPQSLTSLISPELTEHFQPALLARCKVVPFLSLSRDVLQSVVKLKLDKVAKRLAGSHGISFNYSDAIVAAVTEHCSSPQTGARNIDTVINTALLPAISAQLLSVVGIEQEGKFKSVNVDIEDEGTFSISFDCEDETEKESVAAQR